MIPWSPRSSGLAYACYALALGWVVASRIHARSAQPAASAVTTGASPSASQGIGRGTASYAERRLRGLRRAGMMTMPDEPQQPEIDEKFIGEWLKYGFAELQIYMVKHAQFDAWLQRHPTQPEEGNTE